MTTQLHYPGDHTKDIVGRVMGPTTVGQLLTVISADYDEATDTTTAHLRPSTTREVESAHELLRAPAGLGGAA